MKSARRLRSHRLAVAGLALSIVFLAVAIARFVGFDGVIVSRTSWSLGDVHRGDAVSRELLMVNATTEPFRVVIDVPCACSQEPASYNSVQVIKPFSWRTLRLRHTISATTPGHHRFETYLAYYFSAHARRVPLRMEYVIP